MSIAVAPPRPAAPTAHPSDEALALRIRRGDGLALTALVLRYAGPMHGLARHFAGTDARAAQVVTQVFARMLDELPKVDVRDSLSLWLWALAAEACLRARLPTRPAPLDATSEAIRQLPPRARLLWLLHDGAGRSFADLAWIFECPEARVRAQTHRARLALARALSGPAHLRRTA